MNLAALGLSPDSEMAYRHILRRRDSTIAEVAQLRPATWYLGAYPWDRANHPVCRVAPQDAAAAAAGAGPVGR